MRRREDHAKVDWHTSSITPTSAAIGTWPSSGAAVRGAPPALWEGRVEAVSLEGGRDTPQRPNKGRKLRVRFKDFSPEYDEWVSAESKRVRAPGGGGGALIKDF